MVKSLRDLADGEGVVVPVAIEGYGHGIGDEDPIDAEAGFEALKIRELELGPAGLGESLFLPGGAELWDFGDDRCVLDGVSEGASFGQRPEAMIVLAGGG